MIAQRVTLSLTLAILGAPLAAQQPPPAAAAQDTSLAARLERAERLLEILRQQVSEQAVAKVEPRSRNRVELSGLILMNAFANDGKVNNADVPQVAERPDPPGSLPAAHQGATIRQSEIALTAIVPGFAGGAFQGELDVDFYGGQQPTSGGRTWPLMRLRRLRAEIRWPRAWVMFGQEAPPIADVNPSSLAQLGLAGFVRSGNLWLWIPQARLGVETSSAVKVGLEAAVLAPTAGEAQGTFFTQPDRAERSGRPGLEGRIRARWDRPHSAGEVSLGGHLAWLTRAADDLVASRAAALSARLAAADYVELRGEIFVGQVLAGLGGGGIGQNLGPGGIPVRTRGGWAQLNLHPLSPVEVGAGLGLDDPDDRDLDPATALLLNRAWEAHLQWRPAPLVFGAEVRRLATTYGPPVGRQVVHHVNLAAGFEF
jgi:hypothetical protein